MSRKLPSKEGDYYARNLPHWQPENAVLFMTVRLYGSLPKSKIEELQETKRIEENSLRNKGYSKAELILKLRKCENLYFGRFDKLLDENTTGPHWLKEKRIATIWANSLAYFDDERYKVICSTIMSNHVHFIFYKLDRSLSQIMKTIKGFSAWESNKILNRVGERFWQIESFDRMIRNREELKNRINYTLNNPVEVGLVKHWKEYPYNYIHPDFLKFVDESSLDIPV